MEFRVPKRRKKDSHSITEASSSSSPLTRPCSYDVFLSFRGTDTRNNFTGHLYSYLVQKGIKTFIDDEEIRKGEEVSSELRKAIQGSKISILIFSENYASSRWCLDELVEILQCKKLMQQMVRPVFYKVEPSDVRNQTGIYAKHLADQECKHNIEKVKRWRTALTEAAELSGWHHSHGGHEASFISKIGEEISAKIATRSYLNVAKYPVGIESRVEDMLELLDAGGSDIRMVGIWGVGGIGKSTIARATFNTIRHQFEGSCFLPDVRAASIPHEGGLARLQNDLLHGILGGKKMKMTNADRGIQEIKDRLGSKRVLIVLDDVNELNQLDKLAGGLDWFGPGSRIIITTRDKGLLNSHEVDAIYTAKALDIDEARNLLIMNAFKDNRNPDDFKKFPIDAALRYAHGLPLAINILGSQLCRKSIKQWRATIDYFLRSPNSGIQKVLETSYAALDYPLKEAFLDIACFFNGKYNKYVIQALDGSKLDPVLAIQVLEEKALISTTQLGRIWMHALLEEMGREMVFKESPEDPGRRSRLWFHEDVSLVLTENTGSSKVKGIRVQLPTEDEICLSAECFEKMKNLKLFININGRFSGEVNYLPNQLRFLDWPGFPAQSLPSNFNPQKLIKMNMPNSRISRLGQGLNKKLPNLKHISFESCEFLTEFPGMFPNLESLNLGFCTSLAELDSSVGFLDKLVNRNLEGCYNLKMFPRIVNMKCLQDINFKGCKRLENFPEFEGRLESLKCINLSRTAIKEVPPSIGYHLFNLEELCLEQCENLMDLPPNISELQKLCRLNLTGCRNLVLTPFPKKEECSEVLASSSNSNISHYDTAILSERESDGDDVDGDDECNLGLAKQCNLNVGGCNTSDIDVLMTIFRPSAIKMLDLSESNFVRLPACLAKCINLERLDLRGCQRLIEVEELPPNLHQLSVGGCVSLERIWKLSSLLKHEEEWELQWLDLSNCWRLCDNLIQEAEKEDPLASDDHQVEADLFSLFLSAQIHGTIGAVIIPASYEVPKWFSCQMNFEGYRLFEFDIQILRNFKWDNTGLALSVTTRQKSIFWEFRVHISDVLVWSHFDALLGRAGVLYEADSDRMWLQSIPFLLFLDRLGYSAPRPPFKCRVTIYQTLDEYPVPLKSCGVHLVMPPHQECMKLSQAVGVESLDGDLHEQETVEIFSDLFSRPRVGSFLEELLSGDVSDFRLYSSDESDDELESSGQDATK